MFSIPDMVEAGEPVTVSSRAFTSAALADGTVARFVSVRIAATRDGQRRR